MTLRAEGVEIYTEFVHSGREREREREINAENHDVKRRRTHSDVQGELLTSASIRDQVTGIIL